MSCYIIVFSVFPCQWICCLMCLTVFVNCLVKLFAIFLGQKLSPHLRNCELAHKCLFSSCYFFVWFCILCGRVGKSMQLLCILTLGILCLSVMRMMLVKLNW